MEQIIELLLTPAGFLAIIPIVIRESIQLLKHKDLIDSEVALFIAMAFGLVIGLVISLASDTNILEWIILGLASGLIAVGEHELIDNIKHVIKGVKG